MASKLVVIGAVNGKLSEVFSKLTTLHAKQNFAFAIIAGNLFADPEKAGDGDNEQLAKLLRGNIVVPLPTYFALGDRRLPDQVTEKLESSEGELCPNLSILGRKASVKTTEGFRLVAVGGSHAAPVSDEPMSEYAPQYTDADAQAAGKGLTDADLLITTDWPNHIQDGAKGRYQGLTPSSADAISELCAAVKPHYHFSASDSFYERDPFFHNGPVPRAVTRFISLAPYGNTAKEKWIYAFALEPSAASPQVLPPGCTASPLSSGRKRKLESQEANYNSYRYQNGNGNGNGHYERDYRHRKRPRNQPPPTPDQCYFCLSNPKVEQHVIGSIGDNVYLTTAKGPLTTRQTFSELDFPGHVLLIPLEHAPTMSAISDTEARRATLTELQRYRGALQEMIVAKSKDANGRAKLGAVTWEISRNSGVHLHWQFLPVPIDMIQRGLVEAGFDVEAENSTYPKFEKGIKEMEEIEEGNFFKVMIWSEGLRKDMVMSLDGDHRFDLQFGRRVLGKLLGLASRAHWKDCVQPQAEEEADTEAFKEAFKPFESSL